MALFHSVLRAAFIVVSVAMPVGGAFAGSATESANRQRAAAVLAAQSQLGYPSVVQSDGSCCCSGWLTNGVSYSSIGQQIESLATSMKEPVQTSEPSAAALAEGAY